MDKDFNFKQVPRYWAVCYVADCPRKAECLRYQACLSAPENRVYHKCILPTMLKDGHCQQQWIRDLFRRYGYTSEVVFDGSQDVYVFD